MGQGGVESGERLVGFIAKTLTSRGHTLSIAESCTGGLLSSLITDVPGSSDYFAGSIVAYSNEVKERLLGVDGAVLKRHGAVSQETASMMAAGVRKRLKSDVSAAITGIAGPAGGSRAKPVGTVFISVSLRCRGRSHFTATRKFRFRGNRTSIKRQSALQALKMLSAALAVCV